MAHTHLVTRASNVCFAGILSQLLMPVVLSSSEVMKLLPMIIFGVLMMTGAVVTLFLPETRGKELPDSVEESKHLGTVSMATFRKNIMCGSNR